LAIAAALAVSTSLTDVSLSGCGIGDAGAKVLAGALRGLPPSSRLEALNLRSNNIGDEGATALMDAVLGSWLSSDNDMRRSSFFQSLLANRLSAVMDARLLNFCDDDSEED